MNSKIPLPIIKLEQVLPKNENDMKCSPHLNFENGSCIPLNILIKMATAYNKYCDKYDLETKIRLDDKLETFDNSKYKIYLLYEFGLRFKSSQQEWIKNKFNSFMNKEDKEELEKNTFRPIGPQSQFTWLSTFDINLTLEQYEKKYNDFKFLGAVPIDFMELDYLPFKKLNFDKLLKDGKKRIGVIFNLDEHYKSGSHWVSLFIDLEKRQIYFSDSFATPPNKRIVEFIKIVQDYLTSKSSDNIDYRFNRTQHQQGNSECGVYSINFILRLLKGKTFDHITRKRTKDASVNKCRNVYFSKK